MHTPSSPTNRAVDRAPEILYAFLWGEYGYFWATMIGFDLWRSYGGEREGYREVDNTSGFSEAGGRWARGSGISRECWLRRRREYRVRHLKWRSLDVVELGLMVS
jgi:hypothetical protein